MASISKKELKYLKDNLTAEEKIQIVAFKAKMNKRAGKLSMNEAEETSINESLVNQEALDGFQAFVSELNPEDVNVFNNIFCRFANADMADHKLENKAQRLFTKFLNTIEEYIINKAG